MQFGSQSEAVKQLSDAIVDMDTDGDGCISSCVGTDSAAVPFFRYLNRSCLDAAVAFGRANSLRGSTPRRWLHAILDSAALRTAGALDHCGIDCATKDPLA